MIATDQDFRADERSDEGQGGVLAMHVEVAEHVHGVLSLT